jgi:hypothetical protein
LREGECNQHAKRRPPEKWQKEAYRPDKALRFILELLRAGIGLAFNSMNWLTVAGAAPDWSIDVTGLPV